MQYNDDELIPIRLLAARNGWGSGVHPTTRLCLEWICDNTRDGDILLDYGCGSGILSIASIHMGASRCIGVDVEAEALVTAERNFELNGFSADGRFQGLHTREVLPYEVCPPRGASLCVANILIGQLVRPSMVAAITTNLEDGGLLCLSGIRPGEVDSLKVAYNDSFDWLDEQYAELSATETVGSIESYGFDCGIWARLVGKKRACDDASFVEQMSELAVS
jgi:ribosomal protein L11 methylase PrmA